MKVLHFYYNELPCSVAQPYYVEWLAKRNEWKLVILCLWPECALDLPEGNVLNDFSVLNVSIKMVPI